MRSAAPILALAAARAQLYGRMHLVVDVTDRGLELRMAVETKPRGR
jgi:hypothetical protein